MHSAPRPHAPDAPAHADSTSEGTRPHDCEGIFSHHQVALKEVHHRVTADNIFIYHEEQPVCFLYWYRDVAVHLPHQHVTSAQPPDVPAFSSGFSVKAFDAKRANAATQGIVLYALFLMTCLPGATASGPSVEWRWCHCAGTSGCKCHKNRGMAALRGRC